MRSDEIGEILRENAELMRKLGQARTDYLTYRGMYEEVEEEAINMKAQNAQLLAACIAFFNAYVDPADEWRKIKMDIAWDKAKAAIDAAGTGNV